MSLYPCDECGHIFQVDLLVRPIECPRCHVELLTDDDELLDAEETIGDFE